MEVNVDKFKKVGEIFDAITKGLKVAGVVGSVCGSMYFLYYTTNVGVPFPLELNVLATALLFIGVISLAGSSILVLGTLVPALFTDSFPDRAIAFFSADDKSKKLRHIMLRYFLWSWLPFLLLLLAVSIATGIWEISNNKFAWAAGLAVSTFVVIASALKWIGLAKHDRIRYLVLKSLQSIFSIYSFAVALVLAVVAFPEIKELNVMAALAWIMLPFTIINFLVVAPSVPRENSTTDTGKPVAALLTKRKAAPAATLALVVAGLITAYPLLFPPVGAKVGEMTLRGLKAGGGIKMVICTKTKPQTKVLEHLKFDNENCTEGAVYLLLDLGERVYVADQWPISRLGEKSSSDAEPIYFRQDDIRQKVYVNDKLKKQLDK